MTNRLGAGAPIFRVADVRASLAYYVEQLGFTVDWDEGGMVSVTRDRCCVFLCEWEQGQRGTWVWIGVNDAGALHEELVARGARVRHPPTNYAWAYEFQVEDLDGNVLRLGSDPKKGEPFGPFLDAGGTLWATGPLRDETT
jgi:catechol 2,3-dioxygenase-like lactoylglutathione lyase family enzyme